MTCKKRVPGNSGPTRNDSLLLMRDRGRSTTLQAQPSFERPVTRGAVYVPDDGAVLLVHKLPNSRRPGRGRQMVTPQEVGT